MYLSYNEYIEMGGTLSEPAFHDLLVEAEVLIDHKTFGRLRGDKKVDYRVKHLIMRLITLLGTQNELLETSNDNTNQIVTHQSNDGVSVTYGAMSAQRIYQTSKESITSIVDKYLTNVRNSKGQLVLYRGLYENE